MNDAATISSAPRQTETNPAPLNRRFSIAPMMDWTDRHCRHFHRLLSRHALLYTEMVTADAVIHGDRARLLGYAATEHPVALQLGGSEPDKLAEATRIATDYGYDEINLNVGCPSDRVQSGRFGACLMAEPDLVAQCVTAMQTATPMPVTVKCRIGIDDQDEDEDLSRFITAMRGAGITSVTIHARKAWLKGLSPKENRDIPPLNYPRVYRLKQAEPDLEVIINGGIETLEEVAEHLTHVDGAMLGRAAYHNPWLLHEVDHLLFEAPAPTLTRRDVVEQMVDYADQMKRDHGTPLHAIGRHILGLYQGVAGARRWRRHLSENMHRKDAQPSLFLDAADQVEQLAAE